MVTGKLASLKTVALIAAVYLGLWTFFDVLRRTFFESSPSPWPLFGEQIANGLVILYLVKSLGQGHSMPHHEMGLKFRTTWVGLAVGVVVGVILVLITGILSDAIKVIFAFSSAVSDEGDFVNLYSNNYTLRHGIILVLFDAITAVVEEVFFRGIIYSLLRRAFSVLPSVLISSGIFALFHVYPDLIITMFFVGCALSLLRQWSKSVVEPIVAHATLNYLSFVSS